MPYIEEERRAALKAGATPQTPGELNFVMTEWVAIYCLAHGLSYQTINDVLGAFDGASKEFYRRVAVPYEDQKIAANGDVYPKRLVAEA